jgi:hypothetical protein
MSSWRLCIQSHEASSCLNVEVRKFRDHLHQVGEPEHVTPAITQGRLLSLHLGMLTGCHCLL